MALVPGSNAGPYRIVEPLGRGGMASVYRAYEPKLDRYVALKVLPREFLHDPTFAQRFRQEAQVVARLEHPNIIPIYAYDIEEAEGIPWMAMRLITSGSLAELIRRERLPLARSVAILRGVADALDYAHGKGIVHRDVKPQNVLLDEASRVYLADFGIAKILESSGGLTASGMITGTPQYMAPEQATGLKIGPPADVYALGIVAYEMFTGKVPFAADTPVAVLMKHVQEPLPLPPPDVVPEPLLRALLKATTKKPEDRWSSAGAFVEALSAGLGAHASARTAAPTVAIPPTPPLAPPTVVSPATAPPAPGTAQPLPPRPPVMRPPAARHDAAAARRPPSRSGLLLLGLGATSLVLVVGAGVLGLWLWGGRAQEPAPPTPRPGEAPAQETPRPSSARANPATAATAAPRPPADREAAPALPATTPRPSATPAAIPLPTPTPSPAGIATPPRDGGPRRNSPRAVRSPPRPCRRSSLPCRIVARTCACARPRRSGGSVPRPRPARWHSPERFATRTRSSRPRPQRRWGCWETRPHRRRARWAPHSAIGTSRFGVRPPGHLRGWAGAASPPLRPSSPPSPTRTRRSAPRRRGRSGDSGRRHAPPCLV